MPSCRHIPDWCSAVRVAQRVRDLLLAERRFHRSSSRAPNNGDSLALLAAAVLIGSDVLLTPGWLARTVRNRTPCPIIGEAGATRLKQKDERYRTHAGVRGREASWSTELKFA